MSIDATEDLLHLRDLQRYYGKKLNTIQTLFVEEREWYNNTSAGYTSHYLRPFSGLENILVLLEDNDEDDDEDDDEDANDEDNDEDADNEDLLTRANALRAEYAKFLTDHEATAQSIQCMDRSGSFY